MNTYKIWFTGQSNRTAKEIEADGYQMGEDDFVHFFRGGTTRPKTTVLSIRKDPISSIALIPTEEPQLSD